MEKKANRGKRTLGHLVNAVSTNPYALSGVAAGGIGGAVAAGEGNRTKGALGGAVLGGLAGKGLQEGIASFGPKNHIPQVHTFVEPPIENIPAYLRSRRKDVREAISQGRADDIPLKELLGMIPKVPRNTYDMLKTTPISSAAALASGGLAGVGAGKLIRKRKEKQEKKAGIELSLPELHDRTKADDIRSAFGGRLRQMSDEDVVREYAARTANRGRLYGGVLGAGIGSGLLGATIGGGVFGKSKGGDLDLGGTSAKKRIVGGVLGVGLGGYLGGRYGRDHAYHVSDAAIPILRKELQEEKSAEAKQEKKRKSYVPEIAALGTVGLGGAALSRLKTDPAYMQKRKNVMNIMHAGTGTKSKANQAARGALKKIRRAQTLGVGAGGLVLGLAGKSMYDKYQRNKKAKENRYA